MAKSNKDNTLKTFLDQFEKALFEMKPEKFGLRFWYRQLKVMPFNWKITDWANECREKFAKQIELPQEIWNEMSQPFNYDNSDYINPVISEDTVIEMINSSNLNLPSLQCSDAQIDALEKIPEDCEVNSVINIVVKDIVNEVINKN